MATSFSENAVAAAMANRMPEKLAFETVGDGVIGDAGHHTRDVRSFGFRSGVHGLACTAATVLGERRPGQADGDEWIRRRDSP